MSAYQYIREEEDKAEFKKFRDHHLKAFARPNPPKNEVWHYTGAEGLIGILQSGTIWTTQITCLNDSLEQRYFSDLVHASLKEILKENSDPNLAVAYCVIDEALSKADFAGEGRFAACFTEVEDSLEQWRGYGGGECGYAIGFRFDGLLEALKGRPNCLLVPMNYDDKAQKFLVNDLLRMFQAYFLQGMQHRGVTDVKQWTRELSSTFAFELDIFASLIKHPKFVGEHERRITLRLLEGEQEHLEFRQKRTLDFGILKWPSLAFCFGPPRTDERVL